MARSLSQTLTRINPLSTSLSSANRMLNFRHRSDQPAGDAKVPAEEVERVAMKKLEDAVHRMIVKRSAPNWLPLVPGASYWVPPASKARGFVEVVGKLVNSSTPNTSVVKNKSFSLSSSRGWPSSAHFFKGASQSPLEGETASKHTSQSEDEEG